MKKYEELDITDNFMFAKVFSNEDVARDFLQDILKISIDEISVVPEATTQEDPFHKGVRFDVLVKDNVAGPARYFDVELQMENTGELPKRARYYQGMCDLCYKFFYIFNRYSEINDRATREYMQYFATKKCESEKMKRIHTLVERYRKDPVAKKAYMTLEQELNIRYRKGRAEGLREGEARGVAKGHAEGVKEGETKGADSKNKELAKAFRDDGFPIEAISKRTGLTPEEIKAL